MTLWQQAGILIFTIWVLTLLHTIISIIGMTVFQVRRKAVKIGMGKVIFGWKQGSCPVEFGIFPYGGYVSMEMDDFEQRPLFARWIILLAGPVTILSTALLLLGWQTGLYHFQTGFKQLFWGAVSPIKSGVPMITTCFEQSSSMPLLPWTGILAAKLASFHFYPVPPQNFGRIFLELFSRGGKAGWCEKVNLFGAFALIAMYIGWSIALIKYFFF